MYDREELIWDLVSAELSEGRVTEAFRRLTHRVDPNAVLGVDPVVVRRGSGLAKGARSAATGASNFIRGAELHPAVQVSQSLPAVRGVPGYKGTQAYGRMVGAGRSVGSAARSAGSAVGSGARAAGGFIGAGAKGQGIGYDARRLRSVMGGQRVLGGPGGGRTQLTRGGAVRALGGSVGRSAAVYGGAAALTAGAAYGGRALYKRAKARRAEKERD